MTFGTTKQGGQPSAEAASQDDAYEQMQRQHEDQDRQQERTQDRERDDADADDDDENGELSILLGDDDLQDSPSGSDDDDDADRDDDTDGMKRLRGVIRQYKQQLRERDRNSASPAAAMIPAASEFTEPEPQLQDEGIDFDPAKFSEAWKEWNSKKAEHEAGQARRQQKAEELQNALVERQQTYLAAKAEIVKKYPHYVQAEKTAMEHLPDMLQATLLLHSENPTMLVLAVGSNKKLRDQLLASQSDPIALGKLIGTIDAKARLAPRKRNTGSPVPEVRGENGKGSAVANLEAELEKARKTNDYTTVIRLQRQQKARAAAKKD
ncbi:hypothetical protein [Kosakonia phage Kc259]|nr:hypothetical protein [Kosakonia phage Kc259]